MLDKLSSNPPFDGIQPTESAGASAPSGQHVPGERSPMHEVDLKTILRCLELALATYDTREGKLTAQEIRLKSMLSVIRGQVVNQLLSASGGLEVD
jgi:hypothetical protein